MKNFKIKLLSKSVDDLSQFSENVALRQYNRIIERINTLKNFPEMYEEYNQSPMGYKYRKIVIDNYLVFYIIKDDIVQIHRIINSRMNNKKILE